VAAGEGVDEAAEQPVTASAPAVSSASTGRAPETPNEGFKPSMDSSYRTVVGRRKTISAIRFRGVSAHDRSDVNPRCCSAVGDTAAGEVANGA
jgi:hypothetical protein